MNTLNLYNVIFCNGTALRVTFGKTFSDEPRSCGPHCFDFKNAKLTFEEKEKHWWKVDWEIYDSSIVRDCMDLEGQHWFGGPEQFDQEWPIEKLVLEDYSMVTKQTDNAAIIEPYWLSSNGFYIFIEKEAPLFVDQNNYGKGKLCWTVKNSYPYASRDNYSLSYDIVSKSDVRRAHEHAIKTFLGKPTGYPDERMIRDPVWSTWARYKIHVNESVVMDFADEILSRNFSNSQIEIDDDWEICYGALEFRDSKFPDPKKLTDALKSKGFRVTLWIHPFINKNCEPYFSEAKAKGYLIKNENGSVETQWWNSGPNESSAIDFTNPAAVEWWTNRLIRLLEKTGIDGFKFDAGETSWAPQIPILNADIQTQPNILTALYVNTCARFGSMTEVRSASRTQNLPIFLRMIDKDTRWGFDNGLRSLVTTLLQMNLNGYPLVLPDMVGGNAYGNDTITKELFIRWLQANVFMPSIQYSLTPWDIDDETTEIARKFTNLHVKYANKIIHLAKRATEDGSPINPPVWWIAPNDKTAHAINDQYLLGEDLLVAPVMEEGARQRDIYLPVGTWKDENNGEVLTGPKWLYNYTAPLDVLPYFTQITTRAE